jgi:hypothetical protein
MRSFDRRSNDNDSILQVCKFHSAFGGSDREPVPQSRL